LVSDPPPCDNLPSPEAIGFLPDFTPLVTASDTDKDRIWQRVIFYAMEADHEYTAEELSPMHHSRQAFQSGSKKTTFPQLRLWIALVSRQFYRFARPYLYYDVVLRNVAMIIKFASLLLKNPALGSTIRTLSIRPMNLKATNFSELDIDSETWKEAITRFTGALPIASVSCSDEDITRLFSKSISYEDDAEFEFLVPLLPRADTQSPEYKARLKCSRLAMGYILSQTTNLIKFAHIFNTPNDVPCSASEEHRYLQSYEDVALPSWDYIITLHKSQIQSLDLTLSPVDTFDPEEVDFSKFIQLKSLSFCSASGRPFNQDTPDRGLAKLVDAKPSVQLPLEKVVCYKWPASHKYLFSRQRTVSFATVFLEKLLDVRYV
jgi:hypothetical protein